MRDLNELRATREREAEQLQYGIAEAESRFATVAKNYDAQLKIVEQQVATAIREKEEHINRCKADGHDHIGIISHIMCSCMMVACYD
jgi:uncharacterized protein YsxB (DUF464 family)